MCVMTLTVYCNIEETEVVECNVNIIRWQERVKKEVWMTRMKSDPLEASHLLVELLDGFAVHGHYFFSSASSSTAVMAALFSANRPARRSRMLLLRRRRASIWSEMCLDRAFSALAL